MIRPFFVAILAVLAFLPPVLCHALVAAEDPKVIDGIAAVVNGEVITYSQVRMLIAPRERMLRQQFTGEEYQKQMKEARDQALRDLIDRQLIVQLSRRSSSRSPNIMSSSASMKSFATTSEVTATPL